MKETINKVFVNIKNIAKKTYSKTLVNLRIHLLKSLVSEIGKIEERLLKLLADEKSDNDIVIDGITDVSDILSDYLTEIAIDILKESVNLIEDKTKS